MPSRGKWPLHPLAQGTPAEVRARARVEQSRPTRMEDAFIAIVEEARGREDRSTIEAAA